MAEYEDMRKYTKPGGVDVRNSCSAPHPENPDDPNDTAAEWVWCRRRPGHDGDHAAYVFSVITPEYWPQSNDVKESPR